MVGKERGKSGVTFGARSTEHEAHAQPMKRETRRPIPPGTSQGRPVLRLRLSHCSPFMKRKSHSMACHQQNALHALGARSTKRKPSPPLL